MASKTYKYDGVTVVIHNVERWSDERAARAFKPLVVAKARQQAEQAAKAESERVTA